MDRRPPLGISLYRVSNDFLSPNLTSTLSRDYRLSLSRNSAVTVKLVLTSSFYHVAINRQDNHEYFVFIAGHSSAFFHAGKSTAWRREGGREGGSKKTKTLGEQEGNGA